MLATQQEKSYLRLCLTKEMTREQLESAITTAETYLKNLKNKREINPLVAEVVEGALKYARHAFCSGFLSRTRTADSRYPIINRIFNLGIDSMLSLEHEKDFFKQVQDKLQLIQDKKSVLRDQCLWLTLENQNKLIRNLEDKDPAHRDAVNGIVSACVLFGFMSAFLFRSSWFFVASCVAASTKFIPSTNSHGAPSLLGQAVYLESGLRHVGKRLHDALPIGLSHRLFNLTLKGGSLGFHVAERAVGTLERLVDPQQDARKFLEQREHREHVETTTIEDITRLSSDDSCYAARQTSLDESEKLVMR